MTGRVRDDGDLLASEVESLLEGWSAEERGLFEELVEDARSDLQREMILRVVAARHTPAEVHAFADEIRGREDDDVYDLCTVSSTASDVPVTHRFRAEADPYFAMELNGHRLSPRLEDDPGPVYEPVHRRARPRFEAPPALMVPDPPPRVGPAPTVFEEESSLARGRSLTARELGASEVDRPSFSRAGPKPQGRDALLSEAVAVFGLSYVEHLVDEGTLSLEKALEKVAQALGTGVPVPVALGRKTGELGRQALMLQVYPAGKARTFQLHDPFAQETVWVHEKDLLGRSELPFKAKQWRRITAVSLPSSRPK